VWYGEQSSGATYDARKVLARHESHVRHAFAERRKHSGRPRESARGFLLNLPESCPHGTCAGIATLCGLQPLFKLIQSGAKLGFHRLAGDIVRKLDALGSHCTKAQREQGRAAQRRANHAVRLSSSWTPAATLVADAWPCLRRSIM